MKTLTALLGLVVWVASALALIGGAVESAIIFFLLGCAWIALSRVWAALGDRP